MRLPIVLQASSSSDPVTLRHLGGNFLFNREALEDGIGPAGAFDEAVELLGIRHLRYPGGTITEEQFDPANPDATFQPISLITGETVGNGAQHHLTPLGGFLDYAESIGAKVTIVVPTVRYIGAILGSDATAAAAVKAEIATFVMTLLTGPHADLIEAFEIGNEWYVHGFSSAAQYGAVASFLIEIIDAARAEANLEAPPQIAVQGGREAYRIDQSVAIVDAMSPKALDAIDTVILHNYRPMPWDDHATTAGKFANIAVFEAAAGHPLDVLVSEWDIGNASTADGMLQAAGLIDMFGQMVSLGMDAAHIWPVLQHNTTRLAVGDADTLSLTPAGEVYRQMIQSLPGTVTRDVTFGRDADLDGQTDVIVSAFGATKGEGLVIFLASISPESFELDLDLSQLAASVPGGGKAWVTRISPEPGFAPTDHRVGLDFSATAQSRESALADLKLGAYDILRIELPGAGLATVTQNDGPGRNILDGTANADVLSLGADGISDVIRHFDLAVDRLDLSAFGVTDMADLGLNNLVRRDGTVGWIELSIAGVREAVLRPADGYDVMSSGLRAEHFLFATEPLPQAIQRFEDTSGQDTFRGTTGADLFVFADDGTRDLLNSFQPGTDRIDISALGIGSFDELDLHAFQRRDGSTAWIALRDGNGDDTLLFRFDPSDATDPALLTADSFVFA